MDLDDHAITGNNAKKSNIILMRIIKACDAKSIEKYSYYRYNDGNQMATLQEDVWESAGNVSKSDADVESIS